LTAAATRHLKTLVESKDFFLEDASVLTECLQLENFRFRRRWSGHFRWAVVVEGTVAFGGHYRFAGTTLVDMKMGFRQTVGTFVTWIEKIDEVRNFHNIHKN